MTRGGAHTDDPGTSSSRSYCQVLSPSPGNTQRRYIAQVLPSFVKSSHSLSQAKDSGGIFSAFSHNIFGL